MPTILLSPAQLLRLWLQTSGRHWRTHWLQSLTLVAILALGVASFLSIRMANRAAVRGFSGFTDSIAGHSDFRLEAPADLFPIVWLRDIRQAVGHLPVELIPLKEVPALLLSDDSTRKPKPGKELRILGVDLVGIQNVNNSNSSTGLFNTVVREEEMDLFTVIRKSDSIFLSPRLAQEYDFSEGQPIRLLIGDRKFNLRIQGFLPTSRSGVDVPENMAIMDLPAALQLSSSNETLSRVEVIFEKDGKTEEELETLFTRLTEASHGRWMVIRGNEINGTGAEMTAAFRLNLTILSLISLLVGLYLISQSMDAAVIQRRREIGILRAMGLLPSEIRSLWLMDLIAFGVSGSLLGILTGWLVAQTVVKAIARTINTLYLTTTADSAQLALSDWTYGLLLGILGSLIAGSFPLRIAIQTEPAKILAGGRQAFTRSSFRFNWLGIVLLAAGVALSFAPPVSFIPGGGFPVFGYFAAFAWLLGGALTAAGLIAPIGKCLHRLSSNRLTGNLGFGKLRLPGSRHRLAVSGLFVAIGMAASMSILIGSFETTVINWLNTRFQADIYLSSRAFSGATSQHLIQADTLDAIRQWPEIEAVSTNRYLPIRFRNRPTYLVGFQSDLMEAQEKFLWIIDPLPRDQIPKEINTWVIINETFQYRFQVTAGEVITLKSPTGNHRIWIRGVKADYGNDRGALLIDTKFLAEWYGVTDYSNAALYLRDPNDKPILLKSLKEDFPELAVREQATLLKNALQVFQETFAVTYALKVLGLLVAVIGLALALLNILREDVYSLTTLHAMGLRRRELAGVTACEGLGLTLVAAMGGLILSFALGWLLIFVINRQSFGWTLQYRVPWVDLISQSLLLLVLGTLVSWLVGWFSGEQRPMQEE